MDPPLFHRKDGYTKGPPSDKGMIELSIDSSVIYLSLLATLTISWPCVVHRNT